MSMKPLDIVKKLNKAKRDSTKIKIIEDAWNKDCDDFFTAIELSVSPTFNFGLEKVPEILEEDDGDLSSFTFDDFVWRCYDLASNKLSIKEKKEIINDMAMNANITEWNNLYRKILLKKFHETLPMELIHETLKRLTSNS